MGKDQTAVFGICVLILCSIIFVGCKRFPSERYELKEVRLGSSSGRSTFARMGVLMLDKETGRVWYLEDSKNSVEDIGERGPAGIKPFFSPLHFMRRGGAFSISPESKEIYYVPLTELDEKGIGKQFRYAEGFLAIKELERLGEPKEKTAKMLLDAIEQVSKENEEDEK